jgi:hypoxanthine phosphoribosyltransferase
MDIKQIKFSGESITYVTPTWDQMNQLAFLIAKDILKTGKKIDRIVTLAKGGWPMTRSMVDFLQVGKVASIGVKFYKGINERLKEPRIYQDLPISVEGETVLLFDDVADSGESLKFVKKHLEKIGVKEVITATLFYKPHSTVVPDFYGAQTTAWIVFPYDVVEAINMFKDKWVKKGISLAAIKQRFLKLGAKANWLPLYLNGKPPTF